MTSPTRSARSRTRGPPLVGRGTSRPPTPSGRRSRPPAGRCSTRRRSTRWSGRRPRTSSTAAWSSYGSSASVPSRLDGRADRRRDGRPRRDRLARGRLPSARRAERDVARGHARRGRRERAVGRAGARARRRHDGGAGPGGRDHGGRPNERPARVCGGAELRDPAGRGARGRAARHERRAARRPRDAARRRARRTRTSPWPARSASSPTTSARYEEPPAGTIDVVAIEGYAQAFRRADYVARGPLDEHFAFYRNLDIWWSLVLRDPFAVDDDDEDDDEDADDAAVADFVVDLASMPRPRRAVRVEGPDVVRHEHRGWTSVPEAERDRLSKRNFYRVLKQYATRRDLLLGPAVGRGAQASRRRAVVPPGAVGQLDAHRRELVAERVGPRPVARLACRRHARRAAPPHRRGARRPRRPRRGRGRGRARGRRRARATGARPAGRSARSVSRITASAVGRSRSSSIAATNRSWSARPAGDRGGAPASAARSTSGGAAAVAPPDRAAPPGGPATPLAIPTGRGPADPARSGTRRRPRAIGRWGTERREVAAQRRERRAGRRDRVGRVVELAAVAHGQREVPERERVDALIAELGDPLEVAGRLGHLAARREQVLPVDPEADRRAAGDRGRLRDLVLVVREDVVDAAGVDLEVGPEVAHRHRRALEVPAREPVAPGARPAEDPALAGGLPEGEVGAVALVGLDIAAVAGPQAGRACCPRAARSRRTTTPSSRGCAPRRGRRGRATRGERRARACRARAPSPGERRGPAGC